MEFATALGTTEIAVKNAKTAPASICAHHLPPALSQ
jgi:hypothetical protein